jgi:DNA-binding response OmpR family regulator
MSTGDGARTILVVDDEHVLADMLALILDRSGYNSTAVYSAAEALAALKIHPDLIISDVMMPEVDGVELAVEVSKLHPEIKILLISGHAGTREIVEASGLSLDFLAKPFTPIELLTRVAAALDGSARSGE